MITRPTEMLEPDFATLDSHRAKLSCKHIMQVNVSNKVLVGITQGIGNAILTTPLIQALTSMKMKVDILTGGLIRGAEKIFKGMDNVKLLNEDQLEGRIYLLGFQTMWAYQGLEKYVAQVRFAPDIQETWKGGIPAHEVDVNMSLAYSLKYTGEIPNTYCHHNEVAPFLPLINGKKSIGIHICRSYNHQFHANRQIHEPLELGRLLYKAGNQIFILGHEGAVTEADKDEYPEFIYECGADLPDTAGIIKELDCMINEDSGIMHVTAAMDTPQVAIFGPTSSIKNRPWSDKAMVIKRNLSCVSCQYTPRATNCSRNECMDIDHDYIAKQVEVLTTKFNKPE